MTSRALGIADSGVTATPFTDLGPVDPELCRQKFVEAIEETRPGRFLPHVFVSRARMVTLVVRALRTLDPSYSRTARRVRGGAG